MRPFYLSVLALPACLLLPSGTDPAATDTNADVAQLQQLRGQLESHRTQAFNSSVSDLAPVGNALYYKTYPNSLSPRLHRQNADGSTLEYTFSIGSSDNVNERHSETLVVTAEVSGASVIYHAYDASQANVEAGNFSLPAPSDEQKWWAYDASGNTVYVITTEQTATGVDGQVWTYQPGGQPAMLTTLSAVGINLGELLDFGVDGSRMLLIESGRLWSIDLQALTSTWLKNTTEISGGVQAMPDGVTFEDADGLKFYELSSGTLRDVSAELKASSYRLNATYSSAHLFDAKTTGINFSRTSSWVIYTANEGIFAYDLAAKRVVPVLIDDEEESGHRVDYVYPVALDDGRIYAVGLTSEDGAVGVDGPVYQTDLNALIAQ
jgi:hypothetical protein